MPANYVLLGKQTLTASAASVTFSNIPPSGYTDLKFVASARSDAATLATGGLVNFNGVTTGFTTIYMYGTGSSAVSTTGNREFGSMPGSSVTADTFSNSEVIIPNYLSSNYKSYSIDTVTERDATEIYAYLFAGLWSNTAAINSLTYSPASGNFIAGSEFSLYGLAAVGTTPDAAPFATGGDSVTNDGTYWIHTFLSSGTFTPGKALTCDYLVVAGGGGWNTADITGGGGAGGVRSTVGATGGGGSLESPLSVTAQNYAILVGAGGSYANGSDSVFSSVTSLGGGKPGGYQTNGSTGGSGGGAGAFANGLTGGSGTTNQGRAGGNSSQFGSTTVDQGAAGGGGANTAGSNNYQGGGGNGGAGITTAISGTSTVYGGGGGGWGGTYSSTGGSGGGGNGYGGSGTVAGGNGTINTGGGAGGGRAVATGGSGIVIIRYPMV